MFFWLCLPNEWSAVPATWLKAVFVGAWCPKPIVDYTYAWHDAARQAFDDWHLQVIVLGMMQQGMLLTVGCLVAQDGGQMSWN